MAMHLRRLKGGRLQLVALGLGGATFFNIAFACMCFSLSVIPGAVGYGTATPAGRGGQILKVTNLEDSGPGSLRAALETGVPRTILFEVGGEIALSENLVIKHPFVTISGQTAPNPGINISGHGVVIDTHDVLIQHVRIRPGPNATLDDCVSMNTNSTYNIVLDHITAQYAPDEQISMWGGANNISIMNSIISDGVGERHGILIGDDVQKASIQKNIISNFLERSALAKGNTKFIFVKNILYNNETWEFFPIKSDSQSINSIVHGVIAKNIFIDGPATKSYSAIGVNSGLAHETVLYVANNIRIPGGRLLTTMGLPVRMWVQPTISITYELNVDFTDLEEALLCSAGSRPAFRDIQEKRVVKEVRSRGKNKSVDIQEYVSLRRQTKRPLLDLDDPWGDEDDDGYTNLEEVLHTMAIEIEKCLEY